MRETFSFSSMGQCGNSAQRLAIRAAITTEQWIEL
jgi:hypothetical protein